MAQAEAGSDLPATRLQQILHLATRAARDLADNREDRPDRHVHVDVRGAIERVEQQDVLPALERLGNRDDVRLFLGRHGAKPPAMVHRLDDRLVGEDVELLLLLALDVVRIRGAEDVDQTGPADLVGDHLRGERDVVEDAGQLAGGLRVQPLLLDDVPVDRDDRRRSVTYHD